MIEDVKAKLEDETMDVEGPGDEIDPNNPFNRRGEKRGKRGKCKVVSVNNIGPGAVWGGEDFFTCPMLQYKEKLCILNFRPLKTLSFSKFWEKEPLAKSFYVVKRLQIIYML